MLADQNWDQEKVAHIEVYDKTGKLLTAQTVKEKSNINLDWRKKIVFEGELEPLSLNRFSVYIHFAPQKAKRRSDAFVYQNAEKYVEIDRETGLLKSYKVGGKEYIRDGFSLTMFDDNPDPWGMSAFQQKGLGEHGRAFAPMTKPCGVFDGMKQIQVIEDGDIYLGIEAFFCAEHSSARVEYRIYKNTPDIDVRVNLFFNDINRMVKLAIPVCGAEEAVGQTAYGTERLFDDGRENVSQRFLAVKSGEKYLAIYNDCLYGSHFKEGKVYLSLVRGTSYCAHPILDREIIPSDRYVDKMEQGGHEFSFRISVADEQELERGATEFVRKPYALNVFPATQGKGSKAFGVELSNKNIVLSAMKKADEREGLILRLFNNYSKNAETKLTIGGVTCSIEFGKYEVKTVYFDGEIHFLPEMEI
jgi:alpha-mannosidase